MGLAPRIRAQPTSNKARRSGKSQYFFLSKSIKANSRINEIIGYL